MTIIIGNPTKQKQIKQTNQNDSNIIAKARLKYYNTNRKKENNRVDHQTHFTCSVDTYVSSTDAFKTTKQTFKNSEDCKDTPQKV